MAVNEVKQSQGDINQEIADSEARKTKALSAILPSLSLPSSEDVDGELRQIRNEEQKELKKLKDIGRAKVGEKELANRTKGNEVVEEASEEEGIEDNDVKKESGDKEDDTEEDLIPKSKVEKRFKALTAKIRELEAKTASTTQETTFRDSDSEKLEKMTPDELKATLRNVRAKQLRISSGSEDGDIDAYTDLEMKVHEAMNTYGTRFYNDQVKELNKAIASVEYDEDIKDAQAALPEIRRIAEKIYAEHPSFRNSKSGMRTVYELAIEHYKVIQNNDLQKDDTNKLKRDNIKLKRKTSLDSSRVKGEAPENRKLDLIRRKLVSGATDQDRSDYVKASPLFNIDNLLPEEWR